MRDKVKDYMFPVSNPLFADQSLKDVFDALRLNTLPGLPLVDSAGEVLGMVTKESVFREGLDNLFPSTPVTKFLTRDFIVLNEQAAIDEVWPLNYPLCPVIDADNKITGVISQHQVDRAYMKNLRYRINLLEAIFNSTHNGIFAIDSNGYITSINPAAERMAGCAKEDAVGKFLTDVVSPTGLLDVINTGKPQFGKKFQVGKRKYITNRTPIILDDKVIGAVGVIQDISEIEDVSQELNSVKNLNRELEAIINLSFDGILIVNDNALIEKANPAIERVLGVPVKHLAGKNVDILVEQGIFDGWLTDLIKKKPETITTIQNNIINESRLMISVNPILNSGDQVVKWVISVRDLSEILQLQEELAEAKQLSQSYKKELSILRCEVNNDYFVAESATMKSILELSLRVAQVDSAVLIRGEAGTGKKLVARLIHENSRQQPGPFIEVDCASMEDNLLAEELFGYESCDGAKPGIFETAVNGTVLLKNIGAIPKDLQAKLLNVLQEREIRRIGGNRHRKANARIITITHEDILDKVTSGEFRKDLYYSLNIIPISIPPLRERQEDIIKLIEMFQKRYCERYGVRKKFSHDALEIMLDYSWPGNVRELQYVVDRLHLICPRDIIEAVDVKKQLGRWRETGGPGVPVDGVIFLRKALGDLKREPVTEALSETGSTHELVEVLDIAQSRMAKKLGKCNVDVNKK